MQHTILLFVGSLLLPLIVLRPILQRGSAKVAAGGEWKTSGWRTHHHHFGVVLLTGGLLIMLASTNSPASVIPTGIGLGLVLDEFVASLFLPHEEPQAARLYRWSLPLTMFIFGSLIGLLLILAELYAN
jgi:hypothetical protein